MGVRRSMTRKDYNLLAEVFKDNYECFNSAEKAGLRVYLKDLATALHNDNPRFIYHRFYTACGIEDKYLDKM